MSSEDPDAQEPSDNDAKSRVNALLDEMTVKRDEMNSFVDAAKATINNEVEKVRAVLREADGLKGALTSAKNDSEANKNSVDELLQKINKSAQDVEGFKTDIATAKGAVAASQQAVIESVAAIAQSKSDAESLRAAASALSQKLTSDHNQITDQLNSLREKQISLQGVLSEVESFKTSAEGDAAQAKSISNDMAGVKEAFDTLRNDTQARHDELVQRQSNLQMKISEIEDANEKIVSLRNRLLEGSEGAKSVQAEIDSLHTDTQALFKEISDQRNSVSSELEGFRSKVTEDSNAFKEQQDDKFSGLYEALQSRILSLLPSAGAAGLASTYYDAKSRYSPTSFSGRYAQSVGGKVQKFFRRYLGYNPISVVSTVFFYMMFLVPLLIIVYGTFELLHKAENDVNFILTYWMLGLRFLIALPLATISAFGFASLRTNRKLFEEYNHKQRVMELYQSFANEIDAGGDDDLKKKLLAIMLDSVAAKAWDRVESEGGSKNQISMTELEKLTDWIGRIEKVVHSGAA